MIAKTRALAFIVMTVASLRAHADPDPATAPADAAAPPPAAPIAPGLSRFYIRAGVAWVKPLLSSHPLELANVDGPSSLAVQDGPIAGSGSSVSSATVPAVIVGWEVPRHPHWAIETVLGVPFTVKFTATGTLANQSIAPTALGIPTGVAPLGPELGEMKAAPPLFTAIYKLRDHGPITPFVGAGFAVLIAYDAHITNPMLTAVSQPTMSVPPAPGLVLQGGIDAKFYKRWYARLDVKFIALMEARATVDHIQVATPAIPLFGTVDVGTAKMNVWVNPLIIQAALGTSF